MNRILFIEDEPQLLRAMRITLAARGYDVRAVATGRKGLAEAAAAHPDIIVLDLGLPDMDGVDVITAIRGWSTVPIIVLSGRTSGGEKVAALDAGADDYITKPFGIEELLARIRAVTRRSVTGTGESTVDIGAYRIDLAGKRIEPRPAGSATTAPAAPAPPAAPAARAVPAAPASPAVPADPADPAVPANPAAGPVPAGQVGARDDLRLTRTEWRLLEALVRHPGKLVSQRQLITEVWGPAYADDTSSLRLYVNRLRHKLEPDPSRPRYLLTEPGMGYRYQP